MSTVEPCPKCATLLRPGELHNCVSRPVPAGKTADDMVQAIFDRFSQPDEVKALFADEAAKLISAAAAHTTAKSRPTQDGTIDLSAFKDWLDEPPAPPERQIPEDAYLAPKLDHDEEEDALAPRGDSRAPGAGAQGSPDPEPRPPDRSARLVLVGRGVVPADRR